jgi:hypothetical protein
LTDSGVLAANVVNASSPGAGIARFAGSTQTVTSAELSGDVTTSGSNAATVVQIEGAAIPASAAVVGTNSSKQAVAATPHQVALPLQCADTSASATVYTCATTPTLGALTKGDMFIFTSINQNNSGSATLNIDTIGAKTIKKWQGTSNLAAGDLQSANAVLLVYDGTNLEAETIGNAPSGSGIASATMGGSASAIVWTTSQQIRNIYGGPQASNTTVAVDEVPQGRAKTITGIQWALAAAQGSATTNLTFTFVDATASTSATCAVSTNVSTTTTCTSVVSLSVAQGDLCYVEFAIGGGTGTSSALGWEITYQ